MKTYTTKLLNKKCLLLEWQEDYEIVGSILFGKSEQKGILTNLMNLEGWKPITLLSELTDEDVEGLVEKHIPNGITGSPTPYKWYRDYTESIGSSLDYPFLDPLESFFSALEAEGIFLNGNPYEKPKVVRIGCANVMHKSKYNLWHEAEARTFDKTRTILMVEN